MEDVLWQPHRQTGNETVTGPVQQGDPSDLASKLEALVKADPRMYGTVTKEGVPDFDIVTGCVYAG